MQHLIKHCIIRQCPSHWSESFSNVTRKLHSAKVLSDGNGKPLVSRFSPFYCFSVQHCWRVHAELSFNCSSFSPLLFSECVKLWVSFHCSSPPFLFIILEQQENPGSQCQTPPSDRRAGNSNVDIWSFS